MRYLFVLLLVISGMGFGWWAWIPPDSMQGKCQFQNNALWISVDWASQPVDSQKVTELVERVKEQHVKHLYVYTTYLKPDGSFNRSYNYAAAFVTAYKALDAQTRLWAWIGIPLKNHSSLGIQGWVDLRGDVTRRQIAAFAKTLTESYGFDGIHLNVETVWSDNQNFVHLLEEVRSAIGQERLLGIAGAHWMPRSLTYLPVIGQFRWNSAYYHTVGERVDQIATMTYDSHLPFAALYRFWMSEQIKGIRTSLVGLPTELLFGISISREVTSSHRPSVESLAAGLAGVCAGLMQEERESQISRIALYASWEAKQTDWDQLKVWSRY